MNEFRPRSARIDAPKLMYVGFDNDNGGILLNAAEGGIAVRIVNGLPLHSKVELQLRVAGKPPIDAGGEVVWADGSRRVGIRFVEMSESSRHQLRDWVLAEGTIPLNGTENAENASSDLLFTPSERSQTPANTRSTTPLLSNETTIPINTDPNQLSMCDAQNWIQPASQNAVGFDSKSQGETVEWKPLPLGKRRSPQRRVVPVLAGIAIVLVCGTVGLYLRTASAHAKATAALVQSPVRQEGTLATVSSQTQIQSHVAQPNHFPLITAIQARPAGTNTTTVEIALGSGVKYTANRLASPDRIYFDIEADLAPQLWGRASSLKRGPVVKFRSAPRALGVSRVTLQTGDVCAYSATMRPNPPRLVIEVRKDH